MSLGEAADGSSGPAAALGGWIGLALAIAAVAAIYLAPFLRDPGAIPPGLDTPGYVWRASAVWQGGLDALPSFRDRPGHPILVGVLRDLTGATPLDLARAWPAVIAAAIGAAAFALARLGIGERAPTSTALAIGIAAGAFVALTAAAYASNLLVDLFIVGALAAALRVVVVGGRGVAAVVVSTAAAAATHWMFAGLLLAILLIAAVAAAVWPRGEERADDPRRAGRRLLLAVAIAAPAAGAVVLLAPGLPGGFVRETFPGDVDRRIERRIPPLELPATLPAAAAGAIAIAALGGRRRRALPTLVTWAAIAPAGLLAWYALDLPLPPYRTAAAALGVPALIVLGASAPADRLADRGKRAWAAVALVLVVAATAWIAVFGARTWWDEEPGVARSAFDQAATLDAYLRTLPTTTSAIVPVPRGVAPPPRILRLGVDPIRLQRVRLVPADLSGGTMAFVRDVVGQRPDVAVVFLDVYRRPEPGVGVTLGPGVTLVRGPRPAAPLAVPSARTEAAALVRISAIAVAALAVAGAGWAVALTGAPLSQAIAAAPAIGAAGVVVGGLVWGRLGARYDGGGGWTLAAILAASGWIAVVASRAMRARRDDVVADEPAR
jgi:hypothetical protein